MATLSNTDIVVCHKIKTDKEVINFNSGYYSSITFKEIFSQAQFVIHRCTLIWWESWPCPYNKGMWGSKHMAPLILNLGTRWRQVINFTPQPLYPKRRMPRTQWIGGWECVKACWMLWRRENEKSLAPSWNQTPDHPAHSLVTIPTLIRTISHKYNKQEES